MWPGEGRHYRVRMPDEGVADAPVAAIPGVPAAPRPSPALGIVAFVLAVLVALVPDVLTALVRDVSDDDMMSLVGLASVASLVPLVLGIVAAATRRGRYWGIAALTLALLSNYLVFAYTNVMQFYLGSP